MHPFRALHFLTGLLLVPGAILSAQVASGPPDAPAFNQDDVFELEWATDPRMAPDGESVTFVRNFHDRLADRRRSDLWIVGTDDGRLRPLTSGYGNQSSPRYSPSGDRLAWVAATDQGAEIFMHWFDSGTTTRLTQLPAAPRNLTWSPDGSRLAFAMHVASPATSMVSLPSPPEGADWAPPAQVVDTVVYRADGRGMLEEGFVHAFVMPADGGTPRQLTRGDFHHDGGLDWLPDGSALVVSANRREDHENLPLESDLWRVELADGAMTRLTDRDGPETSPRVSADGERIAFVGFEDRHQSHQVRAAWLLDPDDGSIEAVAPELDRSVFDLSFVDGGALMFGFVDQGRGVVARVDRRGRLERLAEDLAGTNIGRPYAGGDLSSHPDGRFAFTLGTSRHPADVAVGTESGRVTRLTELNADLLEHRRLASLETVRFPSRHDDREIQGWILHPPEGAWTGEGPPPLILEIHGGPHTAYGPVFSSELQLFAAAGYRVLYLNPRGSTSYGEAFGNAIQNAYPGFDHDDLMSGVDLMIERGLAGAERLFVTGGSGGGVLTAWIVGTTDRFRAAVVAKPVINWQSFALTADMANYASRYWFPAMPWEDPEHYWSRSPLSRVGNVETPTMLLTGEDDLRTPIGETEQYYQALRMRGVETAMVRIPGAGHGIAARPTHLMSKVAHILSWFDAHGGEPAGSGNASGNGTAP
jgi:acylaminoacyl-peptidase